jgi:alpha-galactosidase
MRKLEINVVLLLLCCWLSASIDNGVGRTPQMGWNSWNHFACNISDAMIRSTVKTFVQDGLQDAGYKYICLDDCWQGYRDDKGIIHPDPDKFPYGIKSLADFVHDNGLLFGIYSDAGTMTCAGYPGSLGFEEQDAQTYASWGVDYLKYDNCYAQASDWVIDRYTVMSEALLKYAPPERPILYATCDWGVQDPWYWASDIANSWRTDNDIADTWDDLLRCLDNTVNLARYAHPGGWNDPDMLEVGNGGMTPLEYESHFALWCLMKAPLLIGCDLTPEGVTNTSGWNNHTKWVLLNEELIAVNQDPLGVAGDLIWKEGPNEVWAGPLDDGSRAVVLFNRHVINSQYPLQNITVNFTWLGYGDDIVVTVRDLYQHQDVGNFTHHFTGVADIHGCMALRITPIDNRPEYRDWRPWQGTPCPDSSSDNSGLVYWIAMPLIALFVGLLVFFLTRAYYKNKSYDEQPFLSPRERQEVGDRRIGEREGDI